ncbi:MULTISPECIES: glycosyltransferase family 2 protein [unclassified Acinetobacter]|uniref:glycosyltransferase family 2 protein n=1 Tax=unclassified Acinetobacter TaxID=196816 RepID=UPI000EF9FACB|nr:MULTISPECIES: glycosyltransferase family 2 protein [unclassified Acinetobacter]MCH7337296.1 glycosyltransferase [Acinetobacter sp. NIPH 2699]RLZ07468.1 glycosyltransferase family 2 protein [Acinetobacter sp. 2JN-4]
MQQLVSIIMPAYKAAKTISDSIESVLAQTYQNFELIVIDDCSPDNTRDIVNQYVSLDNRVKLISKENNQGVAAARNTGLDIVTGDYVAFLDSDDKWDTKKLEKQIQVFKNQDVDVIFSSYYRFNSTGIKNLVSVPLAVDYSQLLKGNCIGNLTAIYKFDRFSSVRQKKIGHEDYLFWLEIFSNSPAVKGIGIQEPLAFYRVSEDGSNVSANKLEAAKWTWNIYRKHLNIGLTKSIFYFICYAMKAVTKRV